MLAWESKERVSVVVMIRVEIGGKRKRWKLVGLYLPGGGRGTAPKEAGRDVNLRGACLRRPEMVNLVFHKR